MKTTTNELAVREAISEYVHPGLRFHMQDLTNWVGSRLGGYCAPDTPGRILRMMRQEGRVNYRVVNRAQSLYEVAQ